MQFRNLDPGIGAQQGGEGPQSGLEAGLFSRACSRRGLGDERKVDQPSTELAQAAPGMLTPALLL